MGFLYYGRDSFGRVSGIRKIAPSRSKKPEHLRPDLSLTPPRKKRRHRLPDESTSDRPAKKPTRQNPIPRRRPPTLEGLPTELLHNIFLAALNPELAATTLGLARVLGGSHLQYRYMRELQDDVEELARIVRFRFFTPKFLTTYENRLKAKVDFTGVPIPSILSSSAAENRDGFALLKMLVERGADCGVNDGDIAEGHRENARDALAMGRKTAVEVMCKVKGFAVDSEMLKVAITNRLGVEFCGELVKHGAVLSTDVWRHVINEGDSQYIEMLMELGVPPGEVLGDLSRILT